MIRQLPAMTPRVETGPAQFGDDWPGIFIRGDNAAFYALHLKRLLDGEDTTENEQTIRKAMLRSLYHDLASAIVGPAKEMFE